MRCGPDGSCPGDLPCVDGFCSSADRCEGGDAAVDVPPGCYGAGDLVFCLGPAPLSSEQTLSGVFDTTVCASTKSASSAFTGCVFSADSVVVRDSKVIGGQPLVVIANKIVVGGVLDASGHLDVPGPGSRGCLSGDGGVVNLTAGGGAGGSFASNGGAGGAGLGGGGGGGGVPGATAAGGIYGGCHGGRGGGSVTGGGGGGGVIVLIGDAVTVDRSVRANGGGGRTGPQAGGGGGSGGSIVIIARTYAGMGALFAVGGGGAGGGNGGLGDGGDADATGTSRGGLAASSLFGSGGAGHLSGVYGETGLKGSDESGGGGGGGKGRVELRISVTPALTGPILPPPE